jgi:hypothetical protein
MEGRDMLLHQRFIPGLAIASYLVGDEKSGEAAIIDPTRDVGDFLRYAEEHGLHVRHVIETHVHADFVSGSEELKLARDLYRSLFEKLPAVPDFTEIFPAHGSGSLCGKAISSRRSSTVGYERRFNPALAGKPEQHWVSDLMAGMPLAPPYFRRMKRVNREGPAVLGPELPGQRRWSAKQVYEQTCDRCLILDVRSKEAFAAHVPSGGSPSPRGPTAWPRPASSATRPWRGA